MKQTQFIKEGYVITSYGNGTAYAIECLTHGGEIFVQGDDAAQLEADTQDFTDLSVLADYFG
jgi:hypothetical protein